MRKCDSKKVLPRQLIEGAMIFIKSPSGIPLIYNSSDDSSVHYKKWIAPHSRVLKTESDMGCLKRILLEGLKVKDLREVRKIGCAFYDNSYRTLNNKQFDYDYLSNIYVGITGDRPRRFTPEGHKITTWNLDDIYTLGEKLHEGDIHLLHLILPELKGPPKNSPFSIEFKFKDEELESFRRIFYDVVPKQ